LENRQIDIFNELSWVQFGLQEVPQTQPQSGTMHRGFGAAHTGFLLNFSLYSSEIWPV